MILIVIVFVSVFAIAVLLSVASGAGASERVKQTLTRLNALLSVEGKAKEEQVDLQKKELFSTIPLFNRILLKLELAPKLRRFLYQANVKGTPGGFLLMSAAAWGISAYLLYLKTGTFPLSLALGLLPAAIPLLYVSRKRAKRFSKFEEGLPAALDLMVSGLRGGHSLVSALGMVSAEAADPIGPEFRICFDEQNYGLELRAAFENLAIRVPIQDVRIVMTAILIQKETGGNLAEVLDKCAHVIRERFRLKKEIRAKTAQGRLSGTVLALMPLGLGILLYLLNPDFVSILWKKPLGIKMMYGGAVMITIGGLIIRKIVSIRV